MPISSEDYGSVIIDEDGNLVAVGDGEEVTENQKGFVFLGKDSTGIARSIVLIQDGTNYSIPINATGGTVNSIIVDTTGYVAVTALGEDYPPSALQISGVGVGAWAPDPSGEYTEPEVGKTAQLMLDGSGNLITRSQTLTDEDSWLEDFSESTLSDNWEFLTDCGASINIASSIAEISSGTAAGYTVLRREGDYGPFTISEYVKISQRIANQTIWIGAGGEPTDPYTSRAAFRFTGTDNTKVDCYIQNSDNSYTVETITLPFGWTTGDYRMYTISVGRKEVRFLVGEEPVSTMYIHVPEPYADMTPGIMIENTSSIGVATIVYVDQILFENHNQLEVAATLNKPLPVRITEEFKCVTGYLDTNSTTVDQIVISYTVPTGRTAFIHSFRLSSANTNVDGDPVKLCKNTPITGASSPGEVDGNVLMAVFLSQRSTVGETYAANPVRFGKAGDIIKVTVSPSGPTSTRWRATLIICLRR